MRGRDEFRRVVRDPSGAWVEVVAHPTGGFKWLTDYAPNQGLVGLVGLLVNTLVFRGTWSCLVRTPAGKGTAWAVPIPPPATFRIGGIRRRNVGQTLDQLAAAVRAGEPLK